MDKRQPYRVNTADGKVKLIVMNATDGLPTAFALLATKAQHKVAIRVLGGCKNMSDADKDEMLDYFATAFKGFRGLVFSGGTRQVTKDGLVDPMITDVPGVIYLQNPGCVALATTPRTDMLTLQEQSRLVLDSNGTVPSPDVEGLLLVQSNPSDVAEWDGDVSTYFQLMEHWRDSAGFVALGTVAWNGGMITRNEIIASAQRGWPTILVAGSGRATDDVIAEFASGNVELLAQLPERPKIFIVSKNPSNLRVVLQENGFLQ